MPHVEQELLTLPEHLEFALVVFHIWDSLFSFSQIICLHIFESVLLCTLQYPRKNYVGFIFTPICFVRSSCFINVTCIYVQHDFHVDGGGTANHSWAPSSPPVFSWICVAWSLVFCVMFNSSLLGPFVLFLLAIVLSVLQYKSLSWREIGAVWIQSEEVFIGILFKLWSAITWQRWMTKNICNSHMYHSM